MHRSRLIAVAREGYLPSTGNHLNAVIVIWSSIYRGHHAYVGSKPFGESYLPDCGWLINLPKRQPYKKDQAVFQSLFTFYLADNFG